MIDYDHSQGGLTSNGNLSNMDGPFEAHWTFDQQGQLVTAQCDLTAGAFALLWDGIAASVGAGGVFWKCLATDPTRLTDPTLYHVVTILKVQDGRAHSRTFLVPSGEADPVFVAWLDILAAPGGVRCGDIMPFRKERVAADVGRSKLASERGKVPA